MNHISKKSESSDGRVHRSDSWELREGGYRRVALLVGNGLWPAHKESALVGFLMERGFRVLSIDVAFGSPKAPRIRLAAFRETIARYAKTEAPPDLPLFLIASSFSASALLPVAGDMRGVAALALVSPIVEFPPPKLRMSVLLPTARLAIERAELCGLPERLDGILEGAAILAFAKSDLKSVAADLARVLEKPFTLPVAVFAAEDDPYLSQSGRLALARAGAKVVSYPGAKRELGHDRCVDGFFADLGSFFDEVDRPAHRQ
jgi:alpha-beta hydrolase superfamily lysophospholipase